MPEYTVVRKTEVLIVMKLTVCLMRKEDRNKETPLCCAVQKINTMLRNRVYGRRRAYSTEWKLS